MDAWDLRQQALMGGAYAPILGNFPPPTRPQSAVDLGPDTSSTWSSSYPTTKTTTATTAPTSYQYSPQTSTGKRNRYAEIMSQYKQAQPYSFTSMPPSYSGGYDTTPYQAYFAPANRYEEIMAQPAMGGGRMTTAQDTGGWKAPTSESAYGVSVFGKNLGLISPLAGAFSSAYGNYLASQVDPNYGHEGRNNRSYSGAPSAGSDVGRSPPGSAHEGAGGYGGGSGEGGGGASSSPGNGGGAGGVGGGGGYAQGGHVSMMHLQGPDPMGPDDGYGALKDGEYVINDKAVKKYGIELMNAINSGRIPKGKLLGLLEM